jgi:hypothetical protein
MAEESNESAPFFMRIMAASVCASNRAARVVRNIMNTGNLRLVPKVEIFLCIDRKFQ